MRLDIRKVFTVLGLYYFAILIQGCCNCPKPPLPYFDYKKIIASASFDRFPISEANVYFRIQADSGSYVSQKGANCDKVAFISQANACSCNENGEYGQKYKIKKINIYPDSIFSSSSSLGDSINELLDVPTSSSTSSNGATNYIFTPLNEVSTFIYAFNLSNEYITIDIRLKAKPIAQRPYTFRIELIKENGEIITTETKSISWEN